MSDLRTGVIVLSSIFTIGAAVPYVADILRGRTKPRTVTWLTWTALTFISAAASLSDRQWAAGALAASAAVNCLIVLVLGLRQGENQIGHFDIVCLAGAGVGLALWLCFDSPSIAVIAAVVIDLVGGLPTVLHAWQRPDEETLAAFALATVGASLTLAAANSTRITELANPIYIALINVTFVAILVLRRRATRSRTARP